MNDVDLEKVKFRIRRRFESVFPLLDVNQLMIIPSSKDRPLSYSVHFADKEIVLTRGSLEDENSGGDLTKKLRKLDPEK